MNAEATTPPGPNLPTSVEAYRAMGFRPIALLPRQKRPRHAAWPKVDLPFEPGDNVGCAVQPFYVVVDVDPRNDGLVTLEALERQHGPLPRTMKALTPSGGFHFLYRVPFPVRTRHSLKGIDILGPGAQHVAVPSVTDAGTYRWAADSAETMADCPAWLLTDVAEHRVEHRAQLAAAEPIEDPGAYQQVIGKALEEARRAEPGEINHTLNAVAYSVGRVVEATGLDPEKVKQELSSIAIDHGGDIGKSLNTVARAFNDGLRNPRPLAPSKPPRPGPKLAPRLVLSRDEFHSIDYPKREMVVEPLLAQSCTFLYGAPGSNKTWLALAMMREAGEAGNASLYVCEEGDPRAVQWRTKAMRMPSNFHILLRQGLKLENETDVAFLIQSAKDNDCRLICLDPLSDCTDSDENDQKEMRKLRTTLRRIVDETGAALLVIHHSNKASDGKPGQPYSASYANLRGSSILAGAADLMLEARKMKDGVWGSEIFMPKSRDVAEQHYPSTLTLSSLGDGTVNCRWVHGEEAREAAVAAKEAKQEQQKSLDSLAKEHVLQTCATRPESKTEIVRLARIKRIHPKFATKVFGAFAQLKTSGAILPVGAGKNTKWQTAPSDDE